MGSQRWGHSSPLKGGKVLQGHNSDEDEKVYHLPSLSETGEHRDMMAAVAGCLPSSMMVTSGIKTSTCLSILMEEPRPSLLKAAAI